MVTAQRARSSTTHFAVLTCTFQKEGKWVTAECQELGTTAFGKNLDEAEKRLREAMLLHLNTLEDAGERRRFFREHNIKLQTTYPEEAHPTIPTKVLSKAQVISVDRRFAFA
jgi:predicted RNase H-like HicB family nuclease